jgi:acyl-lipid omega-6 desaturase (Delta-12 desaturase)
LTFDTAMPIATELAPSQEDEPRALDNVSAVAQRTMMDQRREQVRQFVRHCAKFRTPNWRSASIQMATTALPSLALVGLMWYVSHYAYWLSLLIAIPAGGLLVRVFIIQHDCGHGSFLPSRRLNDLLGRTLSILTWTPYGLWRVRGTSKSAALAISIR